MIKSRGAALITVLVIVFMIMAIITNITVENYRIIRRLSNQKVQAQASSILNAAISFGRGLLLTSGSTTKIDTLNDIWALPIPKLNVLDDIQMGGLIIDEQSKFNLNDLVYNGQINKTILNQLLLLFGYLQLPQALAYNIANYMASPVFQQDIMQQYTTGKPPYRPAGRPLIDISELSLVKGMQPNWVYKLNQYVTAIPQTNDYSHESEITQESQNLGLQRSTYPSGLGPILVNINTASAEVIAAKTGIPLQVAQRIITYRNTNPFKDNNDIVTFLTNNGIMLSQVDAFNNPIVQTNTLTTSSQYFTIHAVVNSGDYEFKLVALVLRQYRSGKWPQVLWQHSE